MSGCSERLKLLRAERGWSQAQLAEKIGMCRSNIANWEAGVRQPGTKAAVKLCRVFNVPLDYILCKSDVRDIDAPVILNGVNVDKLNRKGIRELINYYEYLLTKEAYTK